MSINRGEFCIRCDGDICRGDKVLFKEAVFSGGFHNPRYQGDRWIAAKVVSDSYSARGQHTFTIEVIDSEGFQKLEPGRRTTRKGRNIYRNGVMRMPWANEAERVIVLDKKHFRGAVARQNAYVMKGLL